MSDVFLALGYHRHARLNVHRSGREVDIEAEHRTESRVAIAECKATAAPIGGADLNKFSGVLEAERNRLAKRPNRRAVTGYFVSLAGFTETAIEQELAFDDPRFVRLDAEAVLEQLIEGGMFVAESRAVEVAARVAASTQGLKIVGSAEPVAHQLGWLWTVLFGYDDQPSHVAIVHADGTPLSVQAAAAVIASDVEAGGSLGTLAYLPDPRATPDLVRIQSDYLANVREAVSSITLEGLPADEEVGSRRFQLDELFVPLHLVGANERPPDLSDGPVSHRTRRFRLADADGDEPEDHLAGEPFGAALTAHRRLAITGSPGAGKSTLLKRVALAYAQDDDAACVSDGLPVRDWVPVLLQCRSIADPRRPILDILADFPTQAALPDLIGEPFNRFVAELLRDGRLLLLVDGLDEIADDGARASFVQQLRVLIATYPSMSLVVTSRPRGFRAVASSLASCCTRYDIADLGDADISALSVRWHSAVLGATAEIQQDARDLASAIIESDRVHRLATNPLLLTTLFLVRRWVGDLPRKRAALYGKAIEVLLMTWNVEGHEPVETDEAVPQLAYVAFSMTRDQTQRLSRRRLTELLTEARRELPEVLAYARTSVAQFVDQIEDRSSLLTQSGYVEESGTLESVYEFKHLTFQEYLAALAVVEGYLPNGESAVPAEVLKSRMALQGWSEVVPLAVVLAGRRATPIVAALLEVPTLNIPLDVAADREDDDDDDDFDYEFLDEVAPHDIAAEDFAAPTVAPTSIARLLAQCLSDEALLSPEIVMEASRRIVFSDIWLEHSLARGLVSSRYGTEFLAIVHSVVGEQATVVESPGLSCAQSTYLATHCLDVGGVLLSDWAQRLDLLASGEDETLAAIALSCGMAVAFELWRESRSAIDSQRRSLEKLLEASERAVASTNPLVYEAAAWAMSWLGQLGLDASAPTVIRLFQLWFEAPSTSEQSAFLAWAFSCQVLLDRSALSPSDFPDSAPSFVKAQHRIHDYRDGNRHDRLPASLIAGYYMAAPWSEQELRGEVVQAFADISEGPWREDLWVGRIAAALDIEPPRPPVEDADVSEGPPATIE